MNGKTATFGAILSVSLLASSALAETSINIGCTASTDCASAAVAVYEGIFKKNGIDAKMTLIGINSNIPAALVSDSLQVGGPTASTYLLAVSGGLELQVVGGASSTAESTFKATAAVATPASGIKSPADFAGKKVGVPGIGAFNYVVFVKWLTEKGVDPKSVEFVEVPFLAMNDALKSHAVDAVLTDEPMMSRIIASGNGVAAGYFLEAIPYGLPTILYSASKDWADANPEAVAAFRKSIDEAAKIVNENPDKAREAVSRFTNIPKDVVAEEVLAFSNPVVNSEGLEWWVKSMKEQGLLSADLNPADLIQK